MADLAIERRKVWTPDPAPGAKLRHPVSLVLAHCTVVPDVESTAQAKEIAAMRAVDKAHKKNGWAGYGYNFGIFDSGRIYEGRGWSRVGAHAAGFNSSALGVVWFINGDRRPPTSAAWSTMARFLLLGLKARIIHRDFQLRPHRQFNGQGKTCPGLTISDHQLLDLERWVKTIHAGGG